MKRDLYEQLLSWKEKPDRKPLVLKGARQVGKTWLIKEFGRNEFEQMIVLNCDKDERITDIFDHGFRTERIVKDIEIISGIKAVPEKTLIFIDEVGEVPKALAALKYFCEDAPQYPVIVAGSLFGLAIHQNVSFPVGKVDELTLHPLSFPEFLRAGYGEEIYTKLKDDPPEELHSLHTTFENALREYYFTGGMPEVVDGYWRKLDLQDLRNMQKRILADYAMDISKHADSAILGRIHQVLNSIPAQLAKRNKKFIYGDIQKGARAKDFELAIEWLLDAGIIHKIPRVRKAGIPLKFYEDFSAFKLFLLDHGLMGAMTKAPISQIMLKKNVFEEYRGTFTEQYVLEQMKCCLDRGIFFYDSDTTKLELDFLLQGEEKLVPIEVKAEENLRSKSLRQFYMDHPDSVPIRLSMSGYRKEEWLTNIPLYAVCRLKEVLSA
ncbi:MAG: ATP-binding protein [Lachnospiraceae bacterium]|nr:ATP-binding protein [Lachnospiraceae bacterium]